MPYCYRNTRREYNFKTRLVSIDYEKTFDKVTFETIVKREYLKHLVNIIVSLYRDITIVIDSEKGTKSGHYK